MSNDLQLLWALGYCFFMLVLFLIVKKFPPKKINYYYGYRTNRSMKNEDTWKAAQEYSSKKSIELVLWSFVFPPLFYFLFPEYNFLLSVIAHTLLVLSIFYFTEKYLKERFSN
ncbi:MAG: SdpI family protein [Flavobacteriaceae bacterium]